MSLQELNQLVGIKMLTSWFSRNICFLFHQGGEFSFSLSCWRPWK